jgi:hypothetical protein
MIAGQAALLAQPSPGPPRRWPDQGWGLSFQAVIQPRMSLSRARIDRWIGLPAVELEDPVRDVAQGIAVMDGRDDGSGVAGQMPFEPFNALGVQMVGRLIERQQVWPL